MDQYDTNTSRKKLINGVPKRRLVAFKWHVTNLVPLVTGSGGVCDWNATSKIYTGGVLAE
jgi:hypothetical protein